MPGTDREDLAEYLTTGSAAAFERLARRHADLVYSVCRRWLASAEDAEDAAQGAFLVLARKAGAVRPESLASWLHGVAIRAARTAARAAAARARHEQEAAKMHSAMSSAPDTPGASWAAVRPHLDAEVERLPGKLREAVVRHYLEGRSYADLAGDLGVPEGTVASRVNAGLARLRGRLERRGVGPAVAALGPALAGHARLAAPETLLGSFPRLAAGTAASGAAAGAGLSAAAIAQGVLKMMFHEKLRKWLLGAAAAALLFLAAGVAVKAAAPGGPGDGPALPQPPEAKPAPVAAAPVKGNLSARSEALRAQFARFYGPVKLDLKAPKTPQYALPLDPTKVENWDKVAPLYLADKDAEALVKKNGFAAAGFANDEVVEFYSRLKLQGVPIFVTSDSLLHLYHVQFDETLKDIEEREFFNDALQLAKAMYDASVKQQGEFAEARLKEAARRNAAYFAVALECLASDRTREELQKARAEVAKWTDRDWQKLEGFAGDFPAAHAAARAQAKSPWELGQKAGLLKALDAALAAAPAGRKEVEYALGADLKDEVARELALIEKHEGFAESPIFKYKEDYSQYVPRGHYTRSEKLKRYFKALMWLGRMTFVIKGPSDPGEALEKVSDEDARIQTTGGLLAADLLRTLQLADGRAASEVWDRLYAVTAYYVGLADDLTPYEYTDAAAKALGERYKPADLANDQGFKSYKLELAKLRGPEIYSGTGDCVGPPPGAAGEADLLKALEKTKGFRLMGQRYIPDSFMMGRLVYPTVAPWGGGDFAFTTVQTDGGPARGFPRGLDVMAVLGSDRAKAIIHELRDDRYPKAGKAKSYDEVVAELRAQFAAVSEKDWNRNLYWAWLYCLKALLAKTEGSGSEGLPSFMKTAAWQDKQLNAALASWSQLRHDTILYAKQSYTMRAGSAPRQPKMVEGYVEPVPEFYARLLALTRMTLDGLKDLKVLTEQSEARMRTVEKALVRLVDLSTRELQNEKLADEDYAFIREFASQIKGAAAGVATDGLQTTIVADVHTDGNTRQCLEEGTGMLRNLVVVYPMPDGGFVIGVGPGLAYYEFKQPMSDRLTDEQWKVMLTSEKKPALPEWVGSFSAGK